MSSNVDEISGLKKKKEVRNHFRLTTKGGKVNKTVVKPIQSQTISALKSLSC